ncbi:MAG TPA: DUF2934 domain-containing protein [Myxococcota bacterium]|jgi:hypothetical protein|nr:DUF2934 domain-containing protein [Myxococcota bacterium]
MAQKAKRTTEEQLPASETAGFDVELQEKIRRRAYEIYEERGREEGHELEDWTRAESEIAGQAKSPDAG